MAAAEYPDTFTQGFIHAGICFRMCFQELFIRCMNGHMILTQICFHLQIITEFHNEEVRVLCHIGSQHLIFIIIKDFIENLMLIRYTVSKSRISYI